VLIYTYLAPENPEKYLYTPPVLAPCFFTCIGDIDLRTLLEVNLSFLSSDWNERGMKAGSNPNPDPMWSAPIKGRPVRVKHDA